MINIILDCIENYLDFNHNNNLVFFGIEEKKIVCFFLIN